MVNIGIDIGTETGLAISESKKLTHVASHKILDAMEIILNQKDDVFLHIEDPTQSMYVAKSTKKRNKSTTGSWIYQT